MLLQAGEAIAITASHGKAQSDQGREQKSSKRRQDEEGYQNGRHGADVGKARDRPHPPVATNRNESTIHEQARRMRVSTARSAPMKTQMLRGNHKPDQSGAKAGRSERGRQSRNWRANALNRRKNATTKSWDALVPEGLPLLVLVRDLHAQLGLLQRPPQHFQICQADAARNRNEPTSRFPYEKHHH